MSMSCNVDHRDGDGNPIPCLDVTHDPRPLSAEEIAVRRADHAHHVVLTPDICPICRLIATLDIERARHAALVAAARDVVDSTDLDYALGVAQGEIGPGEYESAVAAIAALRTALDGEP